MSEIKTNKISSLTSSNSDITLDPDGTGNLIVSSGNVGIGTASPSYGMEFASSSGAGTQFGITYAPNSVTLLARAGGADANIGTVGSHPLLLKTGNTERMRIESSGNLLVGPATTTFRTTPGAGVNGADILADDSNGGRLRLSRTGTDGATMISFINTNGEVGAVDTSGTSTTFITSSDYRLKENVADMTGAIDRVKALAPKRFNFIADDTVTVDGFLAHEAQAVVPEAVKGTHNEVEDDGNPVMQGIDQSKLVPLLTGALREAIAKIEALETSNADLVARVTALENA